MVEPRVAVTVDMKAGKTVVGKDPNLVDCWVA